MGDKDEPLTVMQEQMVNAHEIFSTLCNSGFTHSEALYLTGMIICGGPRPPVEGL